MQPAHNTKHLPVLNCTFRDQVFNLAQLADGVSNGSALWLGGQCLSAYLATSKLPSPRGRKCRAVELGSGIGFTALALASMGLEVLATDTPTIIESVLRNNVERNVQSVSGTVAVDTLDWTLPPEVWLCACQGPKSPIVVPPEGSRRQLALSPPFDLIVTADTIYELGLVSPLLRTIHALCRASFLQTHRTPLVYVCFERRDPFLIEKALSEARDTWGFVLARIPHKTVEKALRCHFKWEEEDWEGVELWKFSLNVHRQVQLTESV